MLEFMRKRAKYFYVFFGLVIISFIFYPGFMGDQPANGVIIEVGDTKISEQEYWQIYDNMKNYYRNQYQDKFDSEMEKSLKLKELTLETILTNEFLFIAAQRLGLKVSDDELTEVIMNDPAFIREGIFRKDVYLRVLELSRITPQYYEARMKKELISQKMRRLIGQSAVIDADFTLPEDLKGDKEMYESLRQRLINDKREKVVRSYVETLKKIIPVTVRYELMG